MESQTQFHTIESIELVSSNSRHDFPMHSHRVFCVGIVTDGQLIFQLDGNNLVLNPFDLYFIPAGVAHTILNYQGIPYQHIVVCIHENQLHQIPAAGVLQDTAIGKAFLSLIKNTMETDSENELLQYINELSSSFLLEYDRGEKTAILQAILSYIQMHLDEPFSLDDLCTDISLSKYHLIRLVKAQSGLTPHQIYVQEKIRAVREGILQSDSITDLAYRYRFTDQSHLCHVFKKYVGLTPIQYQKNNLE